MTQAEADKLVQGIFDNIFNNVTKAEVGGKPVMPASTTVLSLMKPGELINASDYKNPYTPGNRTGSKPAALNTVQLVDKCLAMSTLYADNGNRISRIYGEIMDGVQVPAQPPNPAIEKQLKDAWDVLNRVVNVTDPDTGAVTEQTLESVLLRDYSTNEQNYNDQRVAYLNAYFAAMATQSGKETWPLLAPSLYVPVKQAYDKWRSNYAEKIEQARAIQNTSSQNALSKSFDRAKALWASYIAELDEGSGQVERRVSLLPSDWYSVNSETKWITVDSSSAGFISNSSSEYTSGGGSAGFSLGIFTIGGSGGHSKTHRHASTETKRLRVSYQYALVSINRPWLSFHLLATKGWNLQNLYPKGKISNGSKNGQTTSLMPLLPTHFVVAKKVLITADWDKSEWDFVKKETSAGGGFSIGPFSLGGSYRNSSKTYTSSFDEAHGKIVQDGVQVIGWISQVVPYCPPA